MGIENYITDQRNHNVAHVDAPPGELQSLIVSTRPLKEYGNLTTFFFNPNLGIDMDVNGSLGGDPSGAGISTIEDIYNGGDDSFWIPSAISGVKWIPSSIDQNHTSGGSFSLKYDNGAVGDIFQFTHSTGDINLVNFQSLNFWIYIDQNWGVGDSFSIYGWNNDLSVMIGVKAAIEDYANVLITGTWQKASIPLSIMNLSGQTVDSFRIEGETKSGAYPTFYIDDIELEGILEGGEALGPQVFTVQPPQEQWWHVQELNISIAAPITLASNTLPNGTVPYLDYTKFLGLDLEIPFTYQRTSSERIVFSTQVATIGDLLSFPNAIVNLYGDESTTFLQCKIKNNAPTILKGENDDLLRIIISEDISLLDRARVSIGGRREYREKSSSNENVIILNRALR